MSGQAEWETFDFGPRAIVSIPARNEEAYLPACLAALAAQTDVQDRRLPVGRYGVLLLLNNCTDQSGAVARQMKATLPFPLRIVERDLPPQQAHAGGARRLAMDLGMEWLNEGGGGGVLLTTDADSRVSSRWIAENLAAIENGAEAVTGDLTLDSQDEARLPDLIIRRGALEDRYGRQLTEIASLIDPEPHNPWPHHRTASGASIAITSEAYRRIGGLPALPSGEDGALVAALKCADRAVRYAPRVHVVTSGRLIGRARGGTADTIRQRSEDPLAPCDDMLEPLARALLRAHWRHRLRTLYETGLLNESQWVRTLGLTHEQAEEAECFRKFGMFWQWIETTSPLLKRYPLTPQALPQQIQRADRVLARLRHRLAPHREVEPELLASLAARKLHNSIQIA